MTFRTKSPHEAIAAKWHLTLDEVLKAGCELLSALEVGETYGIETPGIRMLYHDLEGDTIKHFRVRLADDSKGKYRTRANAPPHIYLPKRLHKRLKKAAKDPRVPIYITEGEAKALFAALRAGLLCIAIPGVTAWQARGDIAKELDLFEWEGRTVYIIPDSDWVTNTEVRRWFAKLAIELERRGADVKLKLLATLPVHVNPEKPLKSKTGLDDYMAETEDFELKDVKTAELAAVRDWLKDTDTLPAPLLNAQPLPDNLLSMDLPGPEAIVFADGDEDGHDDVQLTNRDEALMLAGAGGVSKTYMKLYEAVAIASGRQVLHFVPADDKGQPVLYVMAERSVASLNRRMQRVVRHSLDQMGFKGDDDPEREKCRQQTLRNITAVALSGTSLKFVQFKNQEWVELTQNVDDFIRYIKARNFVLTILDPLSRLHGGQDSNELAVTMIKTWERIVFETHTGIAVVSHTGKSEKQQSGDSQYSIKGASGWPDNVSAVFTMAVVKDLKNAVRSTEGERLKLQDGEALLLLRHHKCSDGSTDRDRYFVRSDGLLRVAAVETVSFLERFEPHRAAFRAWAKQHQPFTQHSLTTGFLHKPKSPLKSLDRGEIAELLDDLVEADEIQLVLKPDGQPMKRSSGHLYELAELVKQTPTNSAKSRKLKRKK